ncbi:MAG: hypothetical protein HYS18_04025 [Burkholderiales bacterium]|nr:hypothetical protein [Burkholderiales bacterium]
MEYDKMQADRTSQDTPQVQSRQRGRIMIAAFAAALLVAGCGSTAPAAKNSPGAQESKESKTQAAQKTLNEIFRAYESGKPFALDAYMDTKMIDYQSVLDAVRDTQNQQKQISVLTKDVQAVGTGDMVMVQLNWEKRYLALPNLTPKLASGQASFQMKLTAKGWRLAGIKGDNVFAAHAK